MFFGCLKSNIEKLFFKQPFISKKMKANFPIILIYLLFSQSCTFIRYINTHEIVPKSEVEIVNYLIKNKVSCYDYAFSLPVSKIDSFSKKNHALDLWKLNRDEEQSTIQIRIYDSLGLLINGYTQCYGNMVKLNIFSEKETKQFAWLPNNYSLRFENELQLLSICKDKQDEILLKSSQKKYTIVVFWNIWSNYFSRIMLTKLKQYILKYRMDDNLLIILINTDDISYFLNNSLRE